MTEHVFDAEVWEHSPGDPGSWHFLTLPGDVSDDIADEAGPREGFGSVRVVVTIGSTTWRTSLFPDAGLRQLRPAAQEAGPRGRGPVRRHDLPGPTSPSSRRRQRAPAYPSR